MRTIGRAPVVTSVTAPRSRRRQLPPVPPPPPLPPPPPVPPPPTKTTSSTITSTSYGAIASTQVNAHCTPTIWVASTFAIGLPPPRSLHEASMVPPPGGTARETAG